MVIRAHSFVEDRASGALNIDNSTKFAEANLSYLTKTFGSSGDRRTWTYSTWVKRNLRDREALFSAGASTNASFGIEFQANGAVGEEELYLYDYSSSSGFLWVLRTQDYFTDVCGWYHIVLVFNTTESTNTDRIKLYINNKRITNWNSSPSASWPSQNYEGYVNTTEEHSIGKYVGSTYYYNGYMSQVNFIDGQALDPTYFGFTDSLTGSWRPKLYDGTYGTNGFYLPLDGSAEFGQDKSGKGNNFTSFGLGYYPFNEPGAAAYPINDTTSQGNIAVGGVRGRVGVAVTVYNSKYYLDGEEAKTVNFVPGQTVTFDTSDTTVGGHPFRLSGSSNGSHNAFYSVDFDGTGDYLSLASSSDFDFGTDDYTIECWIYLDAAAYNGLWTAGGSYNSGVSLVVDSNGKFWLYDGAYLIESANNAVSTGQWYHVAVSRSSNTVKLFANGAEIGSATQGSIPQGAFYVGAEVASGGSASEINGKISDFRVVKGTAVYTSDFQPPSVPLTNITNTKLLCCNSSTTTGSTVTPGTITANGDPTSSNDNPYDEYVYGTVTSISEGTVGAATTITIPHNSPSNLYYYCTQHSGMGGAVSIGATDHSIADPYAWKNTLALTGIDGADSSHLVNCLEAQKTVTFNSAGISSAKSNFYSHSIYFDGTNDDVTITSTDGLDIGEGDFTVEGWVWNNLSQEQSYVTNWHNGGQFQVQMSSGGALQASWAPYSTAVYAITDTKALPLYCWVHFAYVRKGSTFTLYKDGKSVGTQTSDATTTTTHNIILGENGINQDRDLQGYLQDIRIYKGVAKYTENFLPVSTQPDVIQDSPSGTSYDTESKQLDDGCVEFNGINSELNWTDHADFDMGTDDFCEEFWVFPQYQQASDRQNVLGTKTAWGNGYFLVQVSHPSYPGQVAIWWYYDGTYITASSSSRLPENKWSHVACIRASNTFKIFIDGRLDSTTTITNPGPIDLSLGGMNLGYHGVSDKYLRARISNLRVVKGSQVYTQDFVPSKKPLENITGTKLLCCQNPKDPTAAAVTGSSISNGPSGVTAKTITAHGDVSATSGKVHPNGYRLGIVEFDGTDDYLEIPNSDDWDLGTTWTIECWVYFESLTDYDTIVAQGSNGWYMSGVVGAKMQFYDFDGGEIIESASSSLSTTTWHHVAIVNNGGTAQWYIDGSASGSTASFNASNHSGTLQIGSQGGGWDLNGKITNLRIVKGTAIYTGAFTVPTAPLEWVDNTVLLCCRSSTDVTASGPTRSAVARSSNIFKDNIHTVEGQKSGYCTWNALDNAQGILSDSALYWRSGTPGNITGTLGMPMNSGKYYFEYYIENGDMSGVLGIGHGSVARAADFALGDFNGIGNKIYGYSPNGSTYENSTDTLYGPAMVKGTNISVLFDSDTRDLEFWWNGISQGVAYRVEVPPKGRHYTPMCHGNSGDSGNPIQFRGNWGQQPFKYPVPEGYKTLCTANIQTDIPNPKRYVGISTWTGNETAGRQMYLEFQPDLILGKARNDSTNWFWTDSVRGSNKFLYSNTYGAEATTANILNIDDVNDAGFKLGSSGSLNGTSAYNYFAYAFKAGGNKNTFNIDDVGYASASDAGLSAATNNLTLTGASVGTKQGFSIISYTSVADPGSTCTFAHGLSKAPELLIAKDRDGSSNIDNWGVYYTVNGNNTNWITLNHTDPQGSNASGQTLNGVANVFANLGSDRVYISSNSYANANNADGRNMIAYAWHSVEGFSKFGIYKGSAAADEGGAFTYLGFKPAMLILMDITTGSNWAVVDTTRTPGNPNQKRSRLNTTDSEGSVTWIDLLSNGFKCRAATFPNAAKTYLYFAWADSPFSNMYGALSNTR